MSRNELVVRLVLAFVPVIVSLVLVDNGTLRNPAWMAGGLLAAIPILLWEF